jgi:hypothetical protein
MTHFSIALYHDLPRQIGISYMINLTYGGLVLQAYFYSYIISGIMKKSYIEIASLLKLLKTRYTTYKGRFRTPKHTLS